MKIGFNEEILQLINLHQEGEYWDFKKQWYKDTKYGNMLEDILSMANNLVNRDAYIIIGVDEENNYDICDVREDCNRKNTQNMTDILRSVKFAGDIRPTVIVEELFFDNKAIDVIVVKNSFKTPYFLKEKYYGVFPNNIYVRLQDSNTPIDKSADINHIEYLWKKRFGLLSSPYEKVIMFLKQKEFWDVSPIYDDIMFYRFAPEYTITCTSAEDAKAYEYYMFAQVDSTPHWYEIQIKYHQTVIESVMGLALDGGRYFTSCPNKDGISLEGHGWDIWYSYYVKESTRYLLHEFYRENDNIPEEYAYEDFIKCILVFESEQERKEFNCFVEEKWNLYKDENVIDRIYVKDLKGYKSEVFEEQYRNVQIMQKMLVDFRLLQYS